jgi:hypothetical protein
MPYSDPEVQMAYQLSWMQRRRDEWFAANGPCVDCGSGENLQLDHTDPKQKVSHRVWSWALDRREAELSKCVARCKACHLLKSANEKAVGEANGKSVLTEEVVREARVLYASGAYTWPQLGIRFEVKHDTLRRACKDFWQSVM